MLANVWGRGMLLTAGVVLPLLAGVSSLLPATQPPAPLSVTAAAKPEVFNLPRPGQPVPITPPAPLAPPVDCRKVKCVALTLDDGPVKQTAKVLDVLKSRGARVTFFVLGVQAKARPELLRRMVADGHSVGNHSWNHPIPFGKSSAKLRKQFERTQLAITAAVGPQRPLFRTPFGQVNKRIRKLAAGFGAPLIQWDVDPQDWKYRKTKTVIAKVVKAVRPNSIVLIHDVRPTSRAAVAAIVDRLQAKGYVFVTVPELLGGRIKAGGFYRHG